MSASIAEDIPSDYWEMSDLLQVTSNPAQRSILEAGILKGFIEATIDYHGEFSAADLDYYREAIRDGYTPLVRRRKRVNTAPAKSTSSPGFFSHVESDNKVAGSNSQSSRQYADAAGTAVSNQAQNDVQNTIKGSSTQTLTTPRHLNAVPELHPESHSEVVPISQLIRPQDEAHSDSLPDSLLPLSLLLNDVDQDDASDPLPEGPRIVCGPDDDGEAISDVPLPDAPAFVKTPARRKPPQKQPSSHSKTLASLDYHPQDLRSREEVIAYIKELMPNLNRLVVDFSWDARDAMSTSFRELDLHPLMKNLAMITVKAELPQRGKTKSLADTMTGARWAEFRKAYTDAVKSAFGEEFGAYTWKIDFTPSEQDYRTVKGWALHGNTHSHMWVSLPQHRSAHPRKSKWAKLLNGLPYEKWLEAFVRQFFKVDPRTKLKEPMTWVPPVERRAKYNDPSLSYKNKVNTMINYFKKSGQSEEMLAKSYQNKVSFNWLLRGETNLVLAGSVGLGKL